jgi:hypothetical protein
MQNDDLLKTIYDMTANELLRAAVGPDKDRRIAACNRIVSDLHGSGYMEWSFDFDDPDDADFAGGLIIMAAEKNPGWETQLGIALRVVVRPEKRSNPYTLPGFLEELKEITPNDSKAWGFEFWCAYHHGPLLRAMQRVAILSLSEVECCIRCLRGNHRLCCEAVDHYGGPEAVLNAAISELARLQKESEDRKREVLYAQKG